MDMQSINTLETLERELERQTARFERLMQAD